MINSRIDLEDVSTETHQASYTYLTEKSRALPT